LFFQEALISKECVDIKTVQIELGWLYQVSIFDNLKGTKALIPEEELFDGL
jgi:hypothetical protein